MKFQDHIKANPDLAYCGKCPFLIFPITGALGVTNYAGKNQKNVCGVSQYRFGEADPKTHKGNFEVLSSGPAPVKKDGCLQLFKHFHNQLTKKKKIKETTKKPIGNETGERGFYASICPETYNECLDEVRGSTDYADGRFM